MSPAVYQDKNGIVYLSIEQDVQLAKGRRGHRFVVNKGKSIDVVKIDYETMQNFALVHLEKIKVSDVVNRLLSPINSGATMDSNVEALLRNILQKEAEMAAKKQAEAAAPVATKTTTTPAPAKAVAAPNKAKFAGPANVPAKPIAVKPVAAKTNGAAETEAAVPEHQESELYQTLVVSTEKGKDSHEGSLFRRVHDLAQEPIALGVIIDTLVADPELILKSEKDRAGVIKTRVRDGFTRLGYLQAAAGQ